MAHSILYSFVGPVGLEPTTRRLRISYSAVELRVILKDRDQLHTDLILFLWHKDLLQLFDQDAITTYTDIADFVCDLFYIFHFLQLPQHDVFFHKLCSV